MIDLAISTLVRLGLWADRILRARQAARLAPKHLQLVVHRPVEDLPSGWAWIGSLALLVIVWVFVSLALAGGKLATERDALLSVERLVTAGNLWSW